MKKYFLAFIVVLASVAFVNAQVKAGNKHYDRLAYKKAAAAYERSAKNDSVSIETWSKLGDCYRFLRDSKNAERVYAVAASIPGSPAVNTLYYAEALMQNEKYPEAKTQLEKFKSMDSGDVRGTNLKAGIDNLSAIMARSGAYDVKPTNLNSKESDFCAVTYNGGVVFTSNRKNVEWMDYSHSWTGKQFYRLYQANGSDASFGPATLFANDLQTKYHDGPVCFSKDGKQMYFTRNNIEDGKVKKDDKEVVRMKIYHSVKGDKAWGIEIPFPFNSDQYSCMHPSLSADGKIMYFSSDMPGGQGGMDIWKTDWNGTTWTNPVNMGNKVNTPGNEVFPFISEENVLMFASDGLPGIGGFDLFEMSNGKPENMGSPLNTSFDDFGITYNPTTKSGYFSSNRKNNPLDDDIYFFSKVCTNATVTVVDQESGEPLKEAQVKIFENGTEIEGVITDESGKFTKCLNPLRSYEFKAVKEKYNESNSTLSNTQLSAAAATGAEVKLQLKKIPVIVNIANLSGRVFNADDKSPLANQNVTLLNKTNGKEITLVTDANGNFKADNLELDCEYELKTSKKDCGEPKEFFTTYKITGTKDIKVDIPMLCKGDVIRIENIYYDYNKSDIRPDAAIELDKVVAILQKYPTMKIELRSHTDSRGKDEYNLKLSDNRAKSAVKYIASKGIDSNRLIAKGYGEKEVLNKCVNGVECTDKEHEENRRTEFKILSM
ncbi:MAG: OmpA family protein [Flavobacteriales bacterium]|nr:OmpA family protein [Flavobacteriales bacterium]